MGNNQVSSGGVGKNETESQKIENGRPTATTTPSVSTQDNMDKKAVNSESVEHRSNMNKTAEDLHIDLMRIQNQSEYKHNVNINNVNEGYFHHFKEKMLQMHPRNLDMDPETKEKVKAGLFLGSITGISLLSGFGMTLAVAKRQDPKNFAKGLTGSRELPESGVSLASRALARGTLLSVVGVGLLSFAVWKMLGVHNLTEFRYKVGTMLPTIPKKENPDRGDFRTIRDLFQFIIDEDEREKREAASAAEKPPVDDSEIQSVEKDL